MPEMLSGLMATFFANFMPWTALFWTVSFFWFVDKIRSDQLGTNSWLFKGDGGEWYDISGGAEEPVVEDGDAATADDADYYDDDTLDAMAAANDAYAQLMDEAVYFPLVALGLTCLCILAPIRSIVGAFCVRGLDRENRDASKDYMNKVMSFPTDYDKENPLTRKQGALRWLSIQIAQAEKAGESEKVEALKAQEGAVKTQGAFQ